MAREYPWYELVQDDGLEQGDLLFGLEIVFPSHPTFPLPEQPEVDVDTFDAVVMTQSCDLVQKDLADVIVCLHFDLQTAAKHDPSLAKKGALVEIRKGRRPRYRLLERADFDQRKMGVHIVDFGRVFTLPKSYLDAFAKGQAPRLRLCSPYREYLSQAFASFFMRVGLPRDIDLSRSL